MIPKMKETKASRLSPISTTSNRSFFSRGRLLGSLRRNGKRSGPRGGLPFPLPSSEPAPFALAPLEPPLASASRAART
jgi:hypothetical protein